MLLTISLRWILVGLPIAAVHAQSYSATFTPGDAPEKTQEGQFGTNKCGTGNSQNSTCQNAYINGIDDFCLFAPPQSGPDSLIGNTERIEVSWCIKPGYGTRLIPAGAISGAHFVQTPDFVQVTGVGDLTLLNIPQGDDGGELDPHGADGNGNPIGGLVFSSAFTKGDKVEQIHEWTNFMASNQFCFRACKPQASAPGWCQHIYDVLGCQWNMPGNYDAGVFENCKADSGEMMGVYGGSTFRQGEPETPPAHPAPSSSDCSTVSSIGNQALAASASSGSISASATLTSATSSATSSTSSGSHSASTGGAATPKNTAGSQSNAGAATRADLESSQRVMMLAVSVVLGALMAF